MLFEQTPRFGVTLLDNAPNLFVDGVEKAVGDSRKPGIAIRRQHRQRADALGHGPSPNARSRDAPDALEVTLRACRHHPEGLLLCGHATERTDDPAAKEVAGVAVATAIGCGQRRAQP